MSDTFKIRLTYHGMDGEGATVREAKADAGRKIEQALAEISKAIRHVKSTIAALGGDA